MKISDFPIAGTFNEDDYLLTDGDAAGTRRILAMNAVLSALNLNSYHVRRTIFRGANLGSTLTSEQKAAIQTGSFANLWLGDYWEIGDVIWRIADFDYWYGFGDTKFANHHLLIMPDGDLYTASMNDTNSTSGGYTGSNMYGSNIQNAKTKVSNAFGSAVLSHRDYLVSAVSNGYPSTASWTDSTVEIPNEIMVYGSYIHTPGNSGSTAIKRDTISHTQLALFRANPGLIITDNGFWLRDPVSSADFASVDSTGLATRTSASTAKGVRPVFAIG